MQINIEKLFYLTTVASNLPPAYLSHKPWTRNKKNLLDVTSVSEKTENISSAFCKHGEQKHDIQCHMIK
jgi:hypothetical protein